MACENYNPCPKETKPKRKKKLTILLLDCWQREYDVRPYQNFQLDKLFFEERMRRPFNTIKDLEVVVEFLKQRKLKQFSMTGIDICCYKEQMIRDLVSALTPYNRICLRLNILPRVFFETFTRNILQMKVKELILAGTILCDLDVQDLNECLITSQTLTFLDVSYCNITQFNFPLIADGIHKSTSMRRLSCNRIIGGSSLYLDTQKIACLMAQLIWQWKLTEIVMRECEFSCHDMEPLVEYISCKASVLTVLDLAANKIGPDGAEHLFKAIVSGGIMKKLNISGNSIGPHGGEVVAKYLTSCFHLTHLDITNNDIPYQQINLILTCMEKPEPLLRLELYGNRFNTRSAMILRRLLDSRVVKQGAIDISFTFDEATNKYRIIPWRE